MNQKKIKLFITLFFYIIFLPMIIMLVPVEKWIVKYPIFAVTLILFLYALYFAIQQMKLPQKFMEKKYWQITSFVLIILLLTYLISIFPYPADAVPRVPGLNVKLRHQTVWFMSLTVIGYSLSMSLVMELFRQILLRREIEQKRQSAELALYKSQINPHFFFNTMNTLYGMIVSKSDKTEDAFMRFTDLLRYSYTQINSDSITIKKELDYIRNYIVLQQLRLNDHTKVEFSISVDNDSVMIAPMLLISFVENAFQYGSSSKCDCQIKINFSLQDSILSFHCSNYIMREAKATGESSIGIKNTISRLNILYPDKYDLTINESDKMYCVNLIIQLS